MPKKKRSPAQIAATKKLVALNKRRAKKRSTKPVKKTTIRVKTNPVKKVGVNGLWVVGKQVGNRISYFTGASFGVLTNAARYKSKTMAVAIAKKLANKLKSGSIGVMSVK